MFGTCEQFAPPVASDFGRLGKIWLEKFLTVMQRNSSKQEVVFGVSQPGSALVVSDWRLVKLLLLQ